MQVQRRIKRNARRLQMQRQSTAMTSSATTLSSPRHEQSIGDESHVPSEPRVNGPPVALSGAAPWFVKVKSPQPSQARESWWSHGPTLVLPSICCRERDIIYGHITHGRPFPPSHHSISSAVRSDLKVMNQFSSTSLSRKLLCTCDALMQLPAWMLRVAH